jgi:plastocyanin
MRISSVLLAGSFVLAGCGGSGGGTESPVVASLAIAPAAIDPFVSRGQTVQLSVQAKDGAGNVIGNAPIGFSTGNQNVATVSTSGLITAQSDGNTNITATSGSASQSVAVSVTRKVASITVTPATRTLAPAQTVNLVVRSYDGLGNEITGVTGATFASSNTDAATVDAGGLVRAVAVGTATITATLVKPEGTRTAPSAITVSTTPTFPLEATVALLAASFSPEEVDIRAGGTVTFNNNSGQTHNVRFATIPANNIGDHSSGSFPRTFATAGRFDYSCNLHAGMNGTIIVH